MSSLVCAMPLRARQFTDFDARKDPLMFTVMRDPVLLPSSKTILDRATIKSHLLSDSKDPFNRAPLSIEDVVPGGFQINPRLLFFTFSPRSSRVETPYRRIFD